MRDSDRLQKLCDWAADRGYLVDLHAEAHEADEVDPSTRVITISPTQTQRQKVYSLAHECGHILGFESADFLFSEPRGMASKSARNRLGIVEVELDAWRRGFRLCERLGLGLSPKGFEREACRWLMTYVRDAARLT